MQRTQGVQLRYLQPNSHFYKLNLTNTMSDTPPNTALTPAEAPQQDTKGKFDYNKLMDDAKAILGILQEKGSEVAKEIQEELDDIRTKIADEATREEYKKKAMDTFESIKGRVKELADDADDEVKEAFADLRKEFDEKLAKAKNGELMKDIKEELEDFKEDVQEVFANLKNRFFGEKKSDDAGDKQDA